VAGTSYRSHVPFGPNLAVGSAGRQLAHCEELSIPICLWSCAPMREI
jgi:hypothetical protein